MRTIVERDITEFADVRHAEALPRLAVMIAARAGRPFVATDVGNGFSPRARRRGRQSRHRLTKAPKVFLTESGVAANLTNTDVDSLRRPGQRSLSALTETFVFSEYRGHRPPPGQGHAPLRTS
ncbi:hypothetical protein [Nocardia rhizosphaerae]|uniref:Uncharacterized protein n=1 Tax=Nocardia rhizosphaerae TaxID=1691571 RepID=A0ABV8L3F8_9NOCA